VTNKEYRSVPLRLWSLLILLLICLPAFAQYSGNIQGAVSDPAGAAIKGGSVQLRNSDTGVTAAVNTGESGNYRFSNLPPGNYVLTTGAKGFRRAESSFSLSTSETLGINVALPLAATQQTVGESPGGFADNFGTQTPQISANGRSYTGNLVMVDGLNVATPVQNGNIIVAAIPDAVQEATLQTNSWDGEISLGSSILIQVTTKSGTNQSHGTGSLFFTNQVFQATPEFTKASACLPFARKDLVGTFGGPIQKGKTFFFADFEKLWATTSGAANTGTLYYEDPAFVAWAQSNYPNHVVTQILSGWPASNIRGSAYENALQASARCRPCSQRGSCSSG
jgi:hypothetical protein